jgi:hypothetical protein
MRINLDIGKQDFVALCASNPDVAGQAFDILANVPPPGKIEYGLLKKLCGAAVKSTFPGQYKTSHKIPAIKLVRAIVWAYDQQHPLGSLTDAKKFVEDLHEDYA